MTDRHWIYTTARSGIRNFQRLKETCNKNSQESSNNFKGSLRRKENKCKRKYWRMWKD